MDVKNCRYCGSEISAQAQICPTCRYFQKPSRNTIVFLAGITGFITLVASAGAFILDKASDFYRTWTWKDDVRLVSLDTGLYPHFSAVISNIGSGPVFVSNIDLYWRTANATLYVKSKVDAGDFHSSIDQNVILPEKDYNAFAYSRTGTPSAQLLKEAEFDHESRANKHCFLTKYYLPNESDIQRMNQYYSRSGNKLVAEPARANLIFFSLHSNRKVETSFPVLVTFLRSAMDRCQRIPFE